MTSGSHPAPLRARTPHQASSVAAAEQDKTKEIVTATRRAFLNAKEAKREKVREEARAHKANGLSERATVVEMNCGEGRGVRLLTEKFRCFRARIRRAA